MLLTESLMDSCGPLRVLSSVGDSAVGDSAAVDASAAVGELLETAGAPDREAAEDAARAALRCLHLSTGHLKEHWANLALQAPPAKWPQGVVVAGLLDLL